MFSQGNPAVVACLENERHGLEDDDVIVFSEVVGMEAVNGGQFSVKGMDQDILVCVCVCEREREREREYECEYN